MAVLFPADFPNGPPIDPRTGGMTQGNGKYFFLALFNRTGGGGGSGTTRQPVQGLTKGMLADPATMAEAATPRSTAQGLTKSMVPV